MPEPTAPSTQPTATLDPSVKLEVTSNTAPWWVWPAVAAFGLACVATVALVGGVVYLMGAPGGAVKKSSVDSVLLAKAQKALGENESGVADDYLRGLFLATESLLGVDSFSDRTTFHRYLRNTAEGWKYATDLSIEPGELLADPYDWMEKAGPLTSDDKRQLQHATRAVIFALEAAGK